MRGAAIRAALLGISGLSDYVGDRIYVDKFVDGQTETFIELRHIVSAPNVNSHSGGARMSDLWQLSVRGSNQSDVEEAKELIILEYEFGWRGELGRYGIPLPPLAPYQAFIHIVGKRGGFEQDSRLFFRQLDLEVKYVYTLV